jgi:tetratricopeptide (TPR) repeat protein
MKKIILICLYGLLLFPFASQAKTVTFEERYTYDASEADSKLTCRAISLLQVKRLLLEKLGTYIETNTEVANYQIKKDEISALSASIIKTEILEEKWDGKIYSLTAKINADPDSVAKAIKEMKESREGEEKINKLENVNEKSIEQIKELKEELARIQNNLININRDFSASSEIISAWESYETGLQLRREGKYREAISAFNKSIEHNPKYMHFFQRGRAYIALKQYRNAINDFSTVINLNPDIRNAYFYRGKAYRKIGKKKKGMRDIKKAANLGSGDARRWMKLNSK